MENHQVAVPPERYDIRGSISWPTNLYRNRRTRPRPKSAAKAKARTAAGCPEVRFHDLRHLAGTGEAIAGAWLAGIDLLDGTPIVDLKPYLPMVDAFPDAGHGWLEPYLAAGVEPRLKKPYRPIRPRPS